MKRNKMLGHFIRVSASRIRENEKRLQRLTIPKAIAMMEKFVFAPAIIKIQRRKTQPRKNIIYSILRA